MNLEPRSVIIGTRGSQLALWQARHVAGLLAASRPGIVVELETIRTTGDRIQDVPLAAVGGKALFVKEIEEALLAGRVDLAVHSMKDLPTELPEGLGLAAVPPREDPRDALLSRTGEPLAGLRRGAVVGTSSLRRQAQLLHARPDLTVRPLRGNLDTRIRKLETEGLDAIVVAAAGMRRLGLAARITELLEPEVCLPAVGQGALGVEVRGVRAASREPGEEQPAGGGGKPSIADCRLQIADWARKEGAAAERAPSADPEPPNPRTMKPSSRDGEIAALVRSLDHPDTHLAVRAERAMLRRLEGGCQIPIAGHARREGQALRLTGLVASLDGRQVIRGERRGPAEEPEALGQALAEELLARGAAAILASAYGAAGNGGPA